MEGGGFGICRRCCQGGQEGNCGGNGSFGKIGKVVWGSGMNINNNPLYRTETIENDKLEKLTICGKVRGAWYLSGF